LPGKPLLGDSVNKEQVALGCTGTRNAAKFRDLDNETSFDTVHEMFLGAITHREVLSYQKEGFETRLKKQLTLKRRARYLYSRAA
jgi:hypothetical protein